MKLIKLYQDLKKQSVMLLSKGKLDEYFDTLIELSHLKNRMEQLSLLN